MKFPKHGHLLICATISFLFSFAEKNDVHALFLIGLGVAFGIIYEIRSSRGVTINIQSISPRFDITGPVDSEKIKNEVVKTIVEAVNEAQ